MSNNFEFSQNMNHRTDESDTLDTSVFMEELGHCNEQDIMMQIGNYNCNTDINTMPLSISSRYNFPFLNGCETTIDFDSVELSPSMLLAVQDCEQILQTFIHTNDLNTEQNDQIFTDTNNIQQSNSDIVPESTSGVYTSMQANDHLFNTYNTSVMSTISQTSPPESSTNNNESSIGVTTADIKYNKKPYPPKSMTGFVKKHDQPYALYGHLSTDEIARNCKFDLEGITTAAKRLRGKPRLAAYMINIMCKTTVTKEKIMEKIHQIFNEKIKYVCVGVEHQSTGIKQQMYIQIIFHTKSNKKEWFLDEILNDSQCNYYVTAKDDQWNQYIKQKSNFIEYGLYESLKSHAKIRWSSSPFIRAQQENVSSIKKKKKNVAIEKNINDTVNNDDHNEEDSDIEELDSHKSISINERKEHRTNQNKITTANNSNQLEHINENYMEAYYLKRNIISEQALKLARTSISQAMNFVETNMPYEYMLNAKKFDMFCIN
ncbi:unnamed protein product [Rotaria socialis]|uniref:Uncharacterized protein n=1 Tax=Rotaria socialis TaxID=392032 RepID=A0A817ZXD9_9BILA|nr:unnamed protein product [Rotaria socialis]